MNRKRIIVGVTGASGAPLALSVLRALRAQGVEIHLVLSEGFKRMLREESDIRPEKLAALADAVYMEDDLGARISSGSFVTDGMVVVPCSMKTLSAIANAYDENLLVRAADVCLKEGRRVVLVPRETPLSRAHLRNMLRAAEDGCAIVPPMLSFYAGEENLRAQIEQVTGKILLQFGLLHPEMQVWGEPRREL